MTYSEKVFFKPWVGCDYNNLGLWGQKVLIVGESHYNSWADDKDNINSNKSLTRYNPTENWTIEFISELLETGKGAPFWSKIRNRIGGSEYENAPPENFWNKVAFCNYVQSVIEGSAGKSKPSKVQLLEAKAALLEIINNLSPDRIIVVSYKVWDNLPERHGKLPDLHFGEQKLSVEYFDNVDTRSYITFTAHPRSNLFMRELSPIIKDFILENFTTWPKITRSA